MLDFTKATKPNKTDRIKFEMTPTTELVVENEYCKIYKDSRSGKTFKVINDEVVHIELRELNLWKNRQKNPDGFVVDVIKDENGMVYDYIISRADSASSAAAAPFKPQPAAVQEIPAARRIPPIPPMNKQPQPSFVKQPEAGFVKPDAVTVTTKAPEVTRIKFEMTPTTELVVENEYCKIYKDSRSGKTFKVINGEVAPIELRELNLWKNRQKNPNGFNVEIVKNESGVVYDYLISRASGASAVPQENPTPAPTPAPKAVPTLQKAAPAVSAPAAETPKINIPAVQPVTATQTAVNAANPQATAAGIKMPNASRIKFEMTPTTELVVENEYCKIYKDSRSGKTFKVINGEVAPIELRELNLWKNRQKNPNGFNVEIVKNENGVVYDYIISRANGTSPVQNVTSDAPTPATAPVLNKAAETISPVASADAPTANSNKSETAPKLNKPSVSVPVNSGVSPVTTSVGTAPEGRIDFVMSETTKPVIETEFGTIYNDTRSGKTFKVIDGKIAYIELRELNMWKNRQKNPQGFSINVVKDASGKTVDYTISRINEDGSLTPAPTPAPVMAPVMPDLTPMKNEAPTGANAAGKGRSESKTSVIKAPLNDRIDFEMTPTTKVVVEDEFCTIYNDSRAGKTFKVIGGKVVPIQLRELNMWKNKQRNPKNFAVEIVKDENGNDYDFIITRIGNASSAAVATTSVTTNKAPVVDNGGSDVNKKRRPKSGRLSKCAVCGNEYKEDDLFLFGNRNYCFNCVEEIVKEKQEVAVVDPVQKAIDDIVTADELYCTYSTVTNYPYLDEEFCVNVCTVRRAAETVIENTTVQTIDDKGDFFDDLKRFGLKKIIVNNDRSHIFSPHDFDEHVKTEGVLAPKLYFKILDFMQRRDDELREGIAASFLASKVFTYALNDDITEITEENLDEFKPLTITDGYVNFCPVFTDYSEAKSVGMPFKGLYEIDAKYIVDSNVTHFIINPSSLGFIMNTTILDGVQPNVQENASEVTEETEDTEPTAEIADDVPVAEPTDEIADDAPIAEPTAEIANDAPVAEPAAEITVDAPIAESTSEIAVDAPIAESTSEIAVDAPIAEPTAENAVDAPIAEPTAEIADDATITKPTAKIVADAPISKPAAEITVDAPIAEPAVEDVPLAEPDTMKFFNQPPKARPVGAAFAKPSVTEVIEYNNSLEETAAKETHYIPYISKPTAESSSANAFAAPRSVHDMVNDLAVENETDNSLDLSNLMLSMPDEPVVNKKPRYLIQQQITETKAIARDLEIEPDFGVASILRDKLNESYKNLAKMIAESEKMYAEFDSHTKHILIDGNNRGHIFSDKHIADKSVESFAKNGIDVYIKEYSNSDLFSMLYEYKRHGIQDLVLDESANWIIISTDTISDMLDVDDKEYISIPITNPELMFSMTTLFQKLQSKSGNPMRKAEIQSLERRMIREFTSARYILPLIAYDENNVRPATIDSKNGMKRVLVFSDVFEMKRFFGNKLDLVHDYNIMSYRELIREFTVKANTVVVLNEGSLRFEFNDHNCDHINKVINS